jgi:hypothetical protein
MYCGYAKHHVWIRGTGNCVPCPAWNDKDTLTSNTDVKSFFFGEEMTRLRADLEADVKRLGCDRCHRQELAGDSTRTVANAKYFTDMGRPIGITALEISAGRTCTLKCRMCGPDSSTAWAIEHRSRGLPNAPPTIDWTNIPVDILSDLTYLKITGGEPFLSPNLAVMFRELQEAGISKQLDVEIYTNAEEFPGDRFSEYMRDFKNCRINFSVDGVGKRNEYIRSGSSWPRTVDTMLKWGAWKADLGLDQVGFSISFTYTTFNCLYGLEMVDWVKSMRSYPGLSDLDLDGWHFAEDDSWHNIKRLPDSINEELINLLSDKINELGLPSKFHDGIDPDYARTVYGARVSLQQFRRGLPTGSFDDWWQEIKTLDALRGQDIYQSLPEIVDLFIRHGLLKPTA